MKLILLTVALLLLTNSSKAIKKTETTDFAFVDIPEMILIDAVENIDAKKVVQLIEKGVNPEAYYQGRSAIKVLRELLCPVRIHSPENTVKLAIIIDVIAKRLRRNIRKELFPQYDE